MTTDSTPRIEIDTDTQCLHCVDAQGKQMTFRVSTAKNGTGSASGSGKTPLGRHVIAAKIGAAQPECAVFVGRSPTGEVYDSALAAQYPERDWILSRILWLKGLEPGRNLGEKDGHSVDTFERFIYIHGTPDSNPMGEAHSCGCIRMTNADVMALFDAVQVGCEVFIR